MRAPSHRLRAWRTKDNDSDHWNEFKFPDGDFKVDTVAQIPRFGEVVTKRGRMWKVDDVLPGTAPRGGPLCMDHFRSREWTPAVDSAGVAKPCRIYDLRSTFASNALAAGVTVFELARVMGTSVGMVEQHYGALIDGAHAGIVGRLDAMDAALERAAQSDAGTPATQ